MNTRTDHGDDPLILNGQPGPVPPFEPGDAYEGPWPPTPSRVHGLPPPAGSGRPRFAFLTMPELMAGDYRLSWHVQGVFVRGQPLVFGGMSKTLKTSHMLDLAVSLAGGRPFLGRFDTFGPARVAVLSGESGLGTIQETCGRVMRAKGLTAADVGDRFQVCEELPTLSDDRSVREVAAVLKAMGATVAVFDPLYLCLGDVDPRSMFEMGPVLRSLAGQLRGIGCDPVILHHANGKVEKGRPMDLHHLSHSGLEQFARQFVLLARREEYLNDGNHELWLRVGGSAGHGGLFQVRVEEGLNNGLDFADRRWEVTVSTASEAEAERATEKADTKRQKEDEGAALVLAVIDDRRRDGRPAPTLRTIRDETGFGEPKARRLVGRLLDDAVIVEVEVEVARGSKSRTKGTGYARPGGKIRITGTAGRTGDPYS